MNSHVSEPPTALYVDRELLRFEHPDQWKERPGWRERIKLSEHNLARIVGGYHLGRDLWQHCGLCTTEHGRGYVVATTDGLETQIGKDCGQKYLGAKFEELERQFIAALETQDRMTRLHKLVAEAGSMRARAEQAIGDCDRASSAIRLFTQKIDRETTLADAFQRAITADGSVFVEHLASDDEFEITRQRYKREVVGRIDGHAATSTKSPKPLIQESVLPLIYGLTADMLSSLTNRSLAAKLKEANEATRILNDADAYVALSKRFTAHQNWQAFAAAFGPDRIWTNDRGRRILQQLIELSTSCAKSNK
jgi:hypothetical protein